MRGPFALLLTGVIATPLFAQNHTAGITDAFEMFESRCIPALSDPEAYSALLDQDPAGSRFVAESDDGVVRVVLPRDMNAAENVTIISTERTETRACLTGFYAGDGDAGETMAKDFLAFVQARDDLEISGGGEVRLPDEPPGHVMSGLSFWRYVLTGDAVPEGSLVSVNIGPEHLEVDGERTIQKPGADQ
ncbi:hypothetical protein [Paracoccus marinaquae]|uniref:Uncharacterized protein n=1 Tax=Paracoccus marinaquae TaxID=2841926 RepID=A0ABS6AJX4_9RHOB|nr:hypothetical protein [Paracoccus marinaquae]MBU3029950.1 hypothetical protein [Paracoccus marinaquae]